MPSTKATAATIAAAVGVIAFWALSTYVHTEVPAPVQAAGVGLLTLVVAYFIPETNPAPSDVEAVQDRGLA